MGRNSVESEKARQRQQRKNLNEAMEDAEGGLKGGIAGGATAAAAAKALGAGAGAIGGIGAAGALAGAAAGMAGVEYSRKRDAEAEQAAAEEEARIMGRAQQIQKQSGKSGPAALRQARNETKK